MNHAAPGFGVDAGGTFTDFVARDGRVVKIPSSRDEPGQVLMDGLAALGMVHDGSDRVVHGTTVATNALLTGDLAATGLLITAGFRDIIALGRQNRPRLYDLHPQPAFEPPASRWIEEIPERLDARGRVVIPLDEEAVIAAGERLLRRGAESLCVCFLHSWRSLRHERRAAALLAATGLPVTTSSGLVPEFREFERFVTAWTNAGLRPRLQRYVADLERRLPRTSIQFMQSDGGSAGLVAATKEPVRLALSGPAGGLVGALAGAATTRRRRLLTLDMGGTSTDVALLDGGLPVTGRCEIGGRPLVVPVLDIHTVGAGGGSIARRDRGGGLRVGPESAGADPGPAAYGRGGPATTTDANLVLGRIAPGDFLDGAFPLDLEAARRQVAVVAKDLGLGLEECALGILRVAEAIMERALRTISLERGHDPREFSLVAFGGAGGLHAVALAESLDMKEAVIPADPGLLSARGMLSARVVRETSKTVIGRRLEEIETEPELQYAALEAEARKALQREKIPAEQMIVQRFCDLRYAGQSHELTVALESIGRTRQAFEAAHERRYGFRMTDVEVELVAIRSRFLGPSPRPPNIDADRARADSVPPTLRKVGFASGVVEAAVWRRSALTTKTRIVGPAVVTEYSATTLVPPGWTARLEARTRALVLEPRQR